MSRVPPAEDIFAETVKNELRKYGKQFEESMAQFLKLKERLIELLDSSIVDGKIQVKTAKDIALLINAYVKLIEAENKVVTSLTHLVKVFNAHDALTVTLVSASTTSESLSTHFSPALVPVLLSDSEEDVEAV
ncbi:MAG: hypothetical protein ACK4I8_11485 [Armatimonadota bacterium]